MQRSPLRAIGCGACAFALVVATIAWIALSVQADSGSAPSAFQIIAEWYEHLLGDDCCRNCEQRDCYECCRGC